jgi:predicted N-acetyltransferase YhbS
LGEPSRREAASSLTAFYTGSTIKNVMNAPAIRVMTRRDIDLALRLFEVAGWGNTRADIERILSYEPHGCFVAGVDGEDVGMVATTSYGPVAWIGNLIVAPEARGRDIGTALMRRAMDHLAASGASSVRLDAVPKAIPLYRRLGFEAEYDSLRFIGEATKHGHAGIMPITPGDIPGIRALDTRFTGLDREKILRRTLHEFPGLCFKAETGGRLVGYIMGREGSDSFKAGPWICEPGRGEAVDLLNALMGEVADEGLWVGVPEGNVHSVKILQGLGFRQNASSLRMCYGDCRIIEDVMGIYGLGAPDKG